jgi:hypothetical protein
MEYYEVALKRPFNESELCWREGYGKKGKALVYVTARTCQNRLDKTFTPAGWQVSYDYLGDRMVCTISCYIKGQWISKSDGAGDTSIEGEKGGISDSFKRCCVAWGIARYLYYPKSFDANRKPAVWATPEGYDKYMEELHNKDIEQWRKEYESSL